MQKRSKPRWTANRVYCALIQAASDDEYPAIERAAESVGLVWRCGQLHCGYVNWYKELRCENCGERPYKP